MVKPIDMDELLLCVGALLRRANIASDKKLTIGDFVIDADEMTTYLGDEEIPLTVKEFNIHCVFENMINKRTVPSSSGLCLRFNII